MLDHQKSKRVPEKHLLLFCFIDYSKTFDCVNHNKLLKFFKRWEYQTTLPVSWETCIQVKKQQLELDMEKQIGSKLVKECVKAVYCHPAYLIICRVYHARCWAGWSTSWNQGHQEKYQQPQIRRWHHLKGRKWRVAKKPLDEGERGEWKSWLKAQHSKN